MTFTQIFSFLLPFDIAPFDVDALALIFFVIIWAVFFCTIYWVYKQAKAENWEHNWYGGDDDNTANDLDAEHGSVMELSEAVATKSEKFADIMPGMILIIGLLGTFLGLGIALNEASYILTSANAVENMDASMGHLMTMLEGLGTKFKTSTWGLLAFILLKVILAKNGYEERRLRWSIEKVKGELDLRRHNELNEHRNNNQQIIDKLGMIAEIFVATISQNQVKNQELLQKLSEDNRAEQQYYSQKLIDKIGATTDLFVTTIDQNHIKNQELLQKLTDHSEDNKNAMVGFIEKNETTVKSLGQSATSMSQAAAQMGDLAKHLQTVIDLFQQNMEEVVDLMKRDLNTTIVGMNASFSENMSAMSSGLNTATKDISNAVNSLSSSVDDTINQVTSTINQSMDLQTKAQSVFVESTDSLNEYVNEMTGLVNKLSGDITGGLKAVSESNRNMVSLAKKTDEILHAVDHSLKGSLNSIESVTTLKPTLENLTVSITENKGYLQTIASNTAMSQSKYKTKLKFGNSKNER